MCYHAEFGRSALKDIGTITEPPKFSLHSLGMEGVADPKIYASPAHVLPRQIL